MDFSLGERTEAFRVQVRAFLDEHRDRLARNPRVARQVGAYDRLRDADGIPPRAAAVRAALRGAALLQ